MTLNSPASSGCSSVFTLPNATSGLRAAALSKIGAKYLQGPHHDAQGDAYVGNQNAGIVSTISLLKHRSH